MFATVHLLFRILSSVVCFCVLLSCFFWVAGRGLGYPLRRLEGFVVTGPTGDCGANVWIPAYGWGGVGMLGMAGGGAIVKRLVAEAGGMP